MEKIQIVDPRLGDKNHLEGHKALNFYVRKFLNDIVNISDEIGDIKDRLKSVENLGDVMYDKIGKDIARLADSVKNQQNALKTQLSDIKKHEVITKTYTGIIDTHSGVDYRVDIVQFKNKGQYKVEILNIDNEVNSHVKKVTMPTNSIQEGSAELKILVNADGEKGILQYNFSVLIYQL